MRISQIKKRAIASVISCADELVTGLRGGNFGHAGRPGEVGGSSPGGGGGGDSSGGSSGSGGGRGSDAENREHQAEVSHKLLKTLIEKDGFSYSPVHDTSPTAGYVVSHRPERSLVIDPKDVTAQVISDYWDKNKDVFTKDPGALIGGWLDTRESMVYFDVPTIVDSHEKAKSDCIKYGEKAYYGLKEGKTFYVDEKRWRERRESIGDFFRRRQAEYKRTGK